MTDTCCSLTIDEFEYAEFFFCDVGESDRQSHTLRIQKAETSPHKCAIRRVHRFVEAVFRAGRPVTDIDGFPVSTTSRAAVQLGGRRVSALTATEDAVGAVVITTAQRSLLQPPTGSGSERPDLPAKRRASLFRVFVGLDRQLRDHLGHRRGLVHDRNRAGIAVVRDVELVVERTTRLQERTRLNRSPRCNHAGRGPFVVLHQHAAWQTSAARRRTRSLLSGGGTGYFGVPRVMSAGAGQE